jgi:hypothetical protein
LDLVTERVFDVEHFDDDHETSSQGRGEYDAEGSDEDAEEELHHPPPQRLADLIEYLTDPLAPGECGI